MKTIANWQEEVDNWIKSHGIRYFDVKTNALLLNEEVGELSRLIARVYGEQSFKNSVSISDQKEMIAEEISDIIFVITCLANQMNIDLSSELDKNIHKKTQRDHDRHHSNPKLE